MGLWMHWPRRRDLEFSDFINCGLLDDWTTVKEVSLHRETLSLVRVFANNADFQCQQLILLPQPLFKQHYVGVLVVE